MRRATAAAVVLALALLAGCAETVERERRALVDTAWRETLTLSDQAVTALLDLYPDLTLTEVDGAFTGERWRDCSSSITGNAVSPTEIQWSSLRDMEIAPPRETATLAAALVDALSASGWNASAPTENDGLVRTQLSRDGFGMMILSDSEVSSVRAPDVEITVYSPCVRAPERMLDWATPAPTPAGSPS